jgi:hypothetical protein
VKPDRSANKTVTQRRSPSLPLTPREAPASPEALTPREALTSPDGGTGDEAPASSAAPHDPQNLNPGGLSVPQLAHTRPRAAPHCPQKRCATPFDCPQAGHTAVAVTEIS